MVTLSHIELRLLERDLTDIRKENSNHNDIQNIECLIPGISYKHTEKKYDCNLNRTIFGNKEIHQICMIKQ